MPDKPRSEELRREAEKLRETATDLMEHAALLITKSVELEKVIAGRDNHKPAARARIPSKPSE